jgi:hypothetical protein
MSAINDSGHAKNVANLSKLNLLIAGLGVTYNPSNDKISATALNDLYIKGEEKQDNVNSKLNEWKNATNNREMVFNDLDGLSTRLLSALQSSDVKVETLKDFAALVKKMRGDHKRSKPVAANNGNQTSTQPEDDTSVSTAKQSYDNKLEHFSKMLLLLKSESLYSPNESAYNMHNLEHLEDSLINVNNAANVSYTNLKVARIERNSFFYSEETGLVDLVKKAKSYVKSIYGTRSQQYRAVTGIKFSRSMSVQKAA